VGASPREGSRSAVPLRNNKWFIGATRLLTVTMCSSSKRLIHARIGIEGDRRLNQSPPGPIVAILSVPHRTTVLVGVPSER